MTIIIQRSPAVFNIVIIIYFLSFNLPDER